MASSDRARADARNFRTGFGTKNVTSPAAATAAAVMLKTVRSFRCSMDVNYQAMNLSSVKSARARIAGLVHVTPTVSASRLGARAGVQLFLKCENFQKTGSFKARGALNKVSQL